MPKIKLYNNYEDPNIFSTLTKPLSSELVLRDNLRVLILTMPQPP
jgi:hypothetical protein